MARTVDISRVGAQLQQISDEARRFESIYAGELLGVHPDYRESARNLVHYLALRESDIRDLQEDLAVLGLSSLGRAERNVLGSVRAVQTALHRIASGTDNDLSREYGVLELHNPSAHAHKAAILGESPGNRDVSIMVTLPTEAATSRSLVTEMLAAGMNAARINCARDGQRVWAAMIDNVTRACRESGSNCKIVMDLAGPKVRTGELRAGPRVFHIKPRRDPLGRPVAPRRVRFIPDDVVWSGTKAAVIPVPRECIETAQAGDEFRFQDTRGKKRTLKILRKDAKGLVLETHRGTYIATGTRLHLVGGGEESGYRVGKLPSIEHPILLRTGDTLVLHKECIPGAPARLDGKGDVVESAHVSCLQPEVFESVSVGQRVSFNDGKIAGEIRATHVDRLDIEVTKAKPTGSKLRGNRGINFPDSDLRIAGLAAADKASLDFVVQHADSIGLSFAREPADIVVLQDEMDKRGCSDTGLIVKIETRSGFRNLPRLLLTAMRRYPAAVMIARGDLAVECGWERLAELQEEILWLCEAAQLPVIWATQVLESTAKTGRPSRAEISDAAMSQRADCVMLNKGPHIVVAIRMLDNILQRMQGHQYKKTARLRRLRFAD